MPCTTPHTIVMSPRPQGRFWHQQLVIGIGTSLRGTKQSQIRSRIVELLSRLPGTLTFR